MGTYGIGVMNLNGKTLQQLNITQNNLIRYSLGIPQRRNARYFLRETRNSMGDTRSRKT
jgi:hypothetical protein